MLQGRRISAGCYQLGIYAVERTGRGRWIATAIGPGTVGDGHMGEFRTFRAAHIALTGEPPTRT